MFHGLLSYRNRLKWDLAGGGTLKSDLVTLRKEFLRNKYFVLTS